MTDDYITPEQLSAEVKATLANVREQARIVRDGSRLWWIILRQVPLTYGDELIYIAIDKEDASSPFPYVGVGQTPGEAILSAKSQVPTGGTW